MMTATDKMPEEPKVMTSSQPTPPNQGRGTTRYCGIIITVVIFLVILVAVPVALRRKDDETVETYSPSTVDFETGVTLVSRYSVRAEVTSRLLRTWITLTVSNALDCSSIRSITMQVPENAKVVDLETSTDDDFCKSNGEVKPIDKARNDFLKDAADGLPTVYMEQQSSFTHSLQVAVPPYGKSTVTLVLEELLQQRLGKVPLEIPFAPNEDIDQMSFELSGENLYDYELDTELSGLLAELAIKGAAGITEMMDGETGANVTRLAMEFAHAREFKLPTVVKAWYTPETLPENGLFIAGGGCFEHIFRPSQVESMAKNIIFVVDVSHDAGGKWQVDTKSALKSFIADSLTERDSFTIQLFSRNPREEVHRAVKATAAEKEAAVAFIDKKWLGDYDTNLHGAVLTGLLRADEDRIAREKDPNSVPTVDILVLISGSRPSVGQWNRRTIVEDIYNLNQSFEKQVKMFSLGFRGRADMELLNAIAVMNGGVSLSLTDDSSTMWQFETFFRSELGDILLYDVVLDYDIAGVKVFGQTGGKFPLLSDGYEVVVRGLYETQDADQKDALVRAVTTAMTKTGVERWQADSVFLNSDDEAVNVCLQSYYHGRVAQLLRFRDAVDLVGPALIKAATNLESTCRDDKKLFECIENEALDLAIKGNIVAQGLTGMVTVDNDKCFDFSKETMICRDGTQTGLHPYYPQFSGGGSRAGSLPVWMWMVSVVVPLLLSSFLDFPNNHSM